MIFKPEKPQELFIEHLRTHDVAFGIVGMLQMVSMWWLTQVGRSAADVAGQIADLLWHGLTGDRPAS